MDYPTGVSPERLEHLASKLGSPPKIWTAIVLHQLIKEHFELDKEQVNSLRNILNTIKL
jgi:hypothetical protein